MVKTQNQFLSKTVYQDLIHLNSPWRKLNEFIDWVEVSLPLADIYNNNTCGNSNYSVLMMAKALFVQKFFGASIMV